MHTIFISSLPGRICVRRATLHPSLEGLLHDEPNVCWCRRLDENDIVVNYDTSSRVIGEKMIWPLREDHTSKVV